MDVKRVFRPPPKIDYSAATDSRNLKTGTSPRETTVSALNNFFTTIYRNAQIFFFLGLMMGLAQGGYQIFVYASKHTWIKFSALDLLKAIGHAPAGASFATILDLCSMGVFVAFISLSIMLCVQPMMRASST